MVARSRQDAPRRPSVPAPARDASGRGQTPVETVHGLRAGLAIFDCRRQDLVRIAYARVARAEVRDLVRWALTARIPCEELPDAEVERLARSPQHEGLCVVARPRRWAVPTDLAEAVVRSRGVAVALDRVRNPYNVGAILRSAAFFGTTGVLLGAPAPHPDLAPTAIRVAEGGAERLMLSRTTDLAQTLASVRGRGIRVFGADGHARTNALGYAFGRPALLVVGHEREGLGDRVRAQCDVLVGVHGAGSVDSLNVAVATGVLLAELARGRS